MAPVSRRRVVAAVAAILVVAAGVGVWLFTRKAEEPVRRPVAFGDIVPAPAQAEPTDGVSFTVPVGATITTSADSAEATGVAAYLASLLDLPAPHSGDDGDFTLAIDPAVTPEEAYTLTVDGHGVTIR